MTYFRFLRKRSIGSRCAERFGSAGWSSAVAFRILCWKKDLKEQNKEEDLQPLCVIPGGRADDPLTLVVAVCSPGVAVPPAAGILTSCLGSLHLSTYLQHGHTHLRDNSLRLISAEYEVYSTVKILQ
ncbi:uncharacterized protein LOC105356069 isoform X1 [Oryzias latipes]